MVTYVIFKFEYLTFNLPALLTLTRRQDDSSTFFKHLRIASILKWYLNYFELVKITRWIWTIVIAIKKPGQIYEVGRNFYSKVLTGI